MLTHATEEVAVTAPELVSALPWDDPAWFDRLLRQHMAPEHRTTLAWLLQAGK
jgi:hypothetical protein